MRLQCFLLLMLLEYTASFKVIRSETVRTKEGAKATLECQVDELPEFCSFIRPDGSELCQPSNVDLVSSNCTTQDHGLAIIKTESSSCKLELHQVKRHHFGAWTCKSMQWENWASGEVSLEPYLQGGLEIAEVWGQVTLEADRQQTFSCKLELDEEPESVPNDPIRWSLSRGEGWEPIFKGITQSKVGDGEYTSSVVFTPTIADNEKILACSSDLTGEVDRVELKMYKFSPEKIEMEPVLVGLGEDAHIMYEFTAIPPLQADKVKWRLSQAGRQLEPIQPGQKMNDGRYMAKNIQYLANNLHRLIFHIHGVEQDDISDTNSLEITIADTQVKSIPFQVRLKEPEPAPEIPPPQEDTEDAEEAATKPALEEYEYDDGADATNSTVTDPIVMREGTSLIIIICIIALCIVLCIVYYSSRQCMDKEENKEEEEEGNITIVVTDKKEETMPLMKNQEASGPEDMKRTEELLLSRLEDPVEPASPASTEADTQPLLIGDRNAGENSSAEPRRPRSDLDHKEIGQLAELMKSFEKDGFLDLSDDEQEKATAVGNEDSGLRLEVNLAVGRRDSLGKADSSGTFIPATSAPTSTAATAALATTAAPGSPATTGGPASIGSTATTASLATTAAPASTTASKVTSTLVTTSAPAATAPSATISEDSLAGSTKSPVVPTTNASTHAAVPPTAAPSATDTTAPPPPAVPQPPVTANTAPAVEGQSLPDRKASVELIRSKTLVLEPEPNISGAGEQQQEKKLGKAELEVRLSPAALNLSFETLPKGPRLDAEKSANDETDASDRRPSLTEGEPDLTSPGIVLKTMSRATPEVRIPIQQQQQHQQQMQQAAATAKKPPPVPLKTPSPAVATSKDTPVVRSTVVATPDGSIKRSNSMDAGTQTPRLRARKFDFDGDSSGSEEDQDQLSQKEKLKLEVEKLKKEMQEVKRRISETPPPTPAENGLLHKELAAGEADQSMYLCG